MPLPLIPFLAGAAIGGVAVYYLGEKRKAKSAAAQGNIEHAESEVEDAVSVTNASTESPIETENSELEDKD